jgi:hypothetical protein
MPALTPQRHLPTVGHREGFAGLDRGHGFITGSGDVHDGDVTGAVGTGGHGAVRPGGSLDPRRSSSPRAPSSRRKRRATPERFVSGLLVLLVLVARVLVLVLGRAAPARSRAASACAGDRGATGTRSRRFPTGWWCSDGPRLAPGPVIPSPPPPASPANGLPLESGYLDTRAIRRRGFLGLSPAEPMVRPLSH